jgi:hypothetical protein
LLERRLLNSCFSLNKLLTLLLWRYPLAKSGYPRVR